MVFKILKFLSFLILLISCAHMQSGKYIKISESKTVEQLAQEHGVDAIQITQANPGKTFQSGDIIFIPMNVGIYSKGFNSKGRKIANDFNNNFIWPIPDSSRITSGFGYRGKRKIKHHNGIDIGAPRGSQIIASESGVVSYSGWMKGYGLVTIVDHSQGVETVYAHAKKNLTVVGDEVTKGDTIAYVGSTGRSTGYHLHFEIRVDNEYVDPLAYIPSANTVATHP